MAIINQRRKIKLIIWFSGFLAAVIVYGVLVYFFELDPGIWLNRHRPEEGGSLVEIAVAARPLERGSMLTGDDIVLMEMEEGFVVQGETDFAGQTLRVDLPEGMPLSESFFIENETPDDDVRLVECEHILLPESLETNEFVDVRILFPSGENMIVLSKKKIERFIRDETGGEKVWLKLNEKEILLLSKALSMRTEAIKASLYMTMYIEPTLQQASGTTFEEMAWQ